MQLTSRAVSSNHAELVVTGDNLILVDCKSTNGSYVNGRRVVEPTELQDEDLIQFADVAFRIRCDVQSTASRTVAEDVCDQALALVQFDRMMEQRLVTPFFQPIVRMDSQEIVGFEVLARSSMFGLESSAAMFSAAARLNMEVELSQMLRWEGIQLGLSMQSRLSLYVNTHPLELSTGDLIESMQRIRSLSADIPIVLEIHEAAVTSPREISELTKRIRDLNIGIAYDDFGAGQTRLGELIAAPPDILKFDMNLLRNIDRASPERQRLLASLVGIVRELGVVALAEGIESEGEATVCRQMGFETAQGYLFGRPAPPRNFTPRV